MTTKTYVWRDRLIKGCIIVGLAMPVTAVSTQVAPVGPAMATGCTVPLNGSWVGSWTIGSGATGNFITKLKYTSTTAGNYKVTGTAKIFGSTITNGGRITGTVVCGQLTFGVVSGTYPITFTGSFTSATAVGPGTFTSNVPGGSGEWSGFRAAPAIVLTTTSGVPGTTTTVNGTSFMPYEQVVVTYKTRLPAPNGVATLCSGQAASDGSFSCTGTIPAGTAAGPLGVHKVLAAGSVSRLKGTSAFTLT